jgi:cytochrome P450
MSQVRPPARVGFNRTCAASILVDPGTTLISIRDDAPIYWSASWGVWVVTRYKESRAILMDHATFSNAERFTTLLERLPTPVQPQIARLRRHYSYGLIQSDPPGHTRLRHAVRNAFAPRAMESLRPGISRLAEDLIDRFADRGSADFMEEFARLLPMSVMCELMGVPKHYLRQLLEWDDAIAGLQATPAAHEASAIAANSAIVAIEGYFQALVEERRLHPTDDLISAMAIGRDGIDPLSDADMMAMCVGLVLGGYQTTRSLLGNTMLCILDRPSLLAKALAHPQIIPSLVEETLRLEGPIQRAWRRVTRDIEIHGQRLRAGDLVYLMLGVADLDPAVYPNPEEFRTDRPTRRHLAFGHGIHFCVGAPLARIEALIATERVIERLPNLRRIGAIEWLPSLHQRTLAHLEVAFDTPARPATLAPDRPGQLTSLRQAGR